MNDFDYDCYRKKQVANSAMRRKCGSKSKKCSLPSDHLTKKQWNERCGSVMSYNLKKPMQWKEFTSLPKDLKEEYMNYLINEFSANARSMAALFGVSVPTVFRLVKNEGLNVKFLKGRYPSGEKEDAFRRFVDGTPDVETSDDVEIAVLDEVKSTPCDAAKKESVATTTRLDGFTMNFSGDINVEMIANSLRYILGSNNKAKIQIVCELV